MRHLGEGEKMAVIGYARTSTIEQVAGFEKQIEILNGAGANRIYKEQTSAVGKRPQFDKMLDYVREGDTIIITKLDRGFRSVKDMCTTVDFLEEKGVKLQVLDMNLDTSTPTGRLMLNLLASIGEFERNIMKERQKVGIAKAKAEKKYTGRKQSIDVSEIKRLRNEEGLNPTQIAKKMGIGRASVYRLLK